MFDKSQLAGLMKKAQEMQTNVKKAQEEVAKIEIQGESGAGMVKVVMTGNHDLKKVIIDDAAMEDKEMLEDLIAAAVNDANKKAEAKREEVMGQATSAFPMLSGMKLPF